MTPWMLTASGQRVDLLTPRPEQIKLNDIAYHLSHINRYTGATVRPYSVGEHALFVSKLAMTAGYPPEVQLWALHHDDHEFAIADISSPTKIAINELAGRNVVGELESRLDVAIIAALGLSVSQSTRDIVKLFDYQALMVERSILMPPHADWEGIPLDNATRASGPSAVYAMEPETVERLFKARHRVLTAQIRNRPFVTADQMELADA